MRVLPSIYRIIRKCEGQLDRRVLRTVAVSVEALIVGGQLSVTAMGRAMRSSTSVRHSIKRVDRLLSNTRLQGDLLLLYRSLAKQVLLSDRPIVLMDWSKFGPDQHVLTAALAVKGRSLPLLNEVHAERLLGRRSVQRRFLKHLREVLPEGCQPIIVTDAGFLTPFFQDVEQMGWHFVGRLDSNTRTRTLKKTLWQPSKLLLSQAARKAVDLGIRWLKKSAPMQVRVVLGAKPTRPKRHSSRRSSNGSQRKARRRANKPWLLVTNLTSETAQQVVAVYRLRMQIEQWFRDTKNPRFGWALRYTRCSSRLRMEVLLLLASMGTLIVLLAGLEAEARGLHRQLQASSRTNRRWLSLFVLGALSINKALVGSHIPINKLPFEALPAL